MVLDKFDLKSLFSEMIKLGLEDLRNGKGRTFGNGVAKLLDDMLMRQEPLLSCILGNYEGDEGHEYRLNNAGLKMNWRVVRHYKDNSRRFMCVIAGDQFDDYEVLGPQLRSLIKQRGCCYWTYEDGRRKWEELQDRLRKEQEEVIEHAR